jgi:hypothetical protein
VFKDGKTDGITMNYEFGFSAETIKFGQDIGGKASWKVATWMI